MNILLFKNFVVVKNFIVFLPKIHEPSEQKLETWSSLVGRRVSIDLALVVGSIQQQKHKILIFF